MIVNLSKLLIQLIRTIPVTQGLCAHSATPMMTQMFISDTFFPTLIRFLQHTLVLLAQCCSAILSATFTVTLRGTIC